MSAVVNTAPGVAQELILISADSHVIEAHDLWDRNLPASFRERAPKYPQATHMAHQTGGTDPSLRVGEMARDGVSAEVLYPTRALNQFAITDVALQQALFNVYNDWIGQYCSAAPDRLFAIACISVWDVKQAVKDIERAKKEGARGIIIWQSTPAELSFDTPYYDPIWEAAAALELPVSLHILTGPPYVPGYQTLKRTPTEFLNYVVTDHIKYCAKALIDIMGSGVFDRFPKLKVVVVENEVSWFPFFVTQLDRYSGEKIRRLGYPQVMNLKPSEYFGRNIFVTFFNDAPAADLMARWGADAWMWSNDYPHPNSTWPNSREIIQRDIGHLPPATQAKLVRETCAKLYGLAEILPLAV